MPKGLPAGPGKEGIRVHGGLGAAKGNSRSPLAYSTAFLLVAVYTPIGWRLVGCLCPGFSAPDSFGLPIFSFCRANFYIFYLIFEIPVFFLTGFHFLQSFLSQFFKNAS